MHGQTTSETTTHHEMDATSLKDYEKLLIFIFILYKNAKIYMLDVIQSNVIFDMEYKGYVHLNMCYIYTTS